MAPYTARDTPKKPWSAVRLATVKIFAEDVVFEELL